MSRMSASDFVSFARIGVGETDETLSDSQLLRLVNQSYMELAAAVEFPELRKTATLAVTSGTAEYSIGFSDDLHIDDMTDTTNGLLLRPISEWQYLKYTQGTGTVSGTPYYWYISGSDATAGYIAGTDATVPQKKVTFFPTPNASATISIDYGRKPPELITSPAATSTIVNEAWDDSILHRAISRAWRLMGDMTKSKQWLEAAGQSDMSAINITKYYSRIPTRTGSVVGMSLRGL